MSNINYSYLFQIELLHKYFASGMCNDFFIIPSAQTVKFLNGGKMIAKQYGNKLFTGIQVDDTNKPFILPALDFQLTFFLQLNNPLFFNYSNLPSSFPQGKMYYFTNRNNNVSNTKNFLSKTIAYNSAITYHPGDIVTDAGGIVFECIATCKNVTPSGANNNNWMQIDNNRYVSEADAVQWLPSISTGTFTTEQTNVAITVEAYNIAAKNFSTQVLSKAISFAQPTKNFKIDLSKLSPGKYKLTVTGVSQFIYINDELSAKPVFAVIEIFNDASIASAYKLLNGTTLRSPLYTIDFLNRATIWKYVLIPTSKGKITVAPATFGFPTTADSTIVSLKPIPLSETPLKINLALSTINNVPVNPVVNVADVACASPQMLTYQTSGPDKYACSEIFLNH
jgi:hypothetical protein